MKKRCYLALCVVLTLMLSLSACSSVAELSRNGSVVGTNEESSVTEPSENNSDTEPNENSSVAGPSGKYANKDIYYVYEFNGNKCHSEMLVSDGGNDGTWKFDETDKNKILIEYDDGVDPLTYDVETDTLSLEGVMEFEKISDEEYAELKKSAAGLQSAIESFQDEPAPSDTGKSTSYNTTNEIEYFSEYPTLPTPDSVYEGISFDEMDGAEYCYYLGTDKGDATAAVQIWMIELMSRDFDIDNYDKDSSIYFIKKDGKDVALFAVGGIRNGYGLVVGFF